MLVVETIARIRRDHLVRGVPIKKIARDLRVSKNTVRKVVRGDGSRPSAADGELSARPRLLCLAASCRDNTRPVGKPRLGRISKMGQRDLRPS